MMRKGNRQEDKRVVTMYDLRNIGCVNLAYLEATIASMFFSLLSFLVPYIRLKNPISVGVVGARFFPFSLSYF